MEFAHATDTDNIGSCPFDIGPHAVEEIGHIHHMGLFRGIFQNGLPFRQGRRHHNIDRCAYGHHVQINMPADQVNGMGQHRPPLNLNLCPQCPKPFQVLVDGPAADIAPARKGHLCTFIFPQQRTDKIIRRTDLTDIVVVHGHFMDRRAVNTHGMAVQALHVGANLLDCLQHHVYIPHIRQIIYHNTLVRHNGSRKDP